MGSPASERGILTALPAFWPGLSLLVRARRAAAVVLRDDLPVDAAPGLHRARLRSSGGEAWLTLPLRVAPPGTRICAVRLAPAPGFAARAMRAIEHAFEDAPFFEHHRCDVARLLFRDWPHLADLAADTTRFLFGAFGIRCVVLRATELPGGVPADASPTRHGLVSERAAFDALFWHGPRARGLLGPPVRGGRTHPVPDATPAMPMLAQR